MKYKQHGFSTIEYLLVLVIAAVVGLVGWYVYGANKKANSIYNAASQNNVSASNKSNLVKYKDGSSTYTLSYPKSWSVDSIKWDGGSGHSIEAVQNSFVQIDPPNATKLAGGSEVNGVSFIARNSGDINAVLEDQLGVQPDGTPFKPQSMTINGNKALRQTITNKDYTDENYFITNGKVTVVILFRVKEAANSSSGSTGFDDTAFLSELAPIVNSVSFVN